jgi:Na+/proline symporter
MKKLVSLFATLCLVLNLQAKTSDFNLDEKKVNAEFGQLNKLEKYVDANENATIADAKVAEIAADVDLDTSTLDVMKELPANIPAFWWGFCLGWVGLIVVYVVTDNDKDQVKKALKGCIISGLIGVAIWVVTLVVGVGSSI